MITDLSQKNLSRLTERWVPLNGRKKFKIHRDSTDFFKIEYNDLLILDKKLYLIRHNAKEGRFGIDDEVKYWVKRAIDLEDGSLKVIKLVFYEKFVCKIGNVECECFRSPKKEARILRLVTKHKNFMHGYSVKDIKGNIVRVLDFVYGKTLASFIENINDDHRAYFQNQFPEILDNFIESIEAIKFLHENGEKHGDIRRDHIIVERNSEIYRWIDYDYNYRQRENIYGYDLFGLGNILLFLAGKGDVLLPDLKKNNTAVLAKLYDEDLNIIFSNRVANLKKIYPYIPESLNNIFMHFSKGAKWFYENTNQLIDDLTEVRQTL